MTTVRPEITGRKGPETSVSFSGPVGMARGPPTPTGVVEPDAYSVAEFCDRHRISVQLYYKLRQKGQTPREFRAGKRVLISREAAAAWRREREAENA